MARITRNIPKFDEGQFDNVNFESPFKRSARSNHSVPAMRKSAPRKAMFSMADDGIVNARYNYNKALEAESFAKSTMNNSVSGVSGARHDRMRSNAPRNTRITHGPNHYRNTNRPGSHVRGNINVRKNKPIVEGNTARKILEVPAHNRPNTTPMHTRVGKHSAMPNHQNLRMRAVAGKRRVNI